MARIGCMDHFNPNLEDFDTYVSRIELFFVANGVKDEKKVASFLTLGGPKIYSLARNLLSPNDPATQTYDVIIAALKEHFKPKVIVIFERYNFYSRVQKSGETVADFVAGLKSLAHTCDFGDQLNNVLRDRFVMGLSNSETQRTLLSESDLTFKRALEVASAREAASRDVLAMGGQHINAIKSRPEHFQKSNQPRKEKPPTPCTGCGKMHWRSDCPYKDNECYSCGKKGHLKSHCFNKKKSNKPVRKGNINVFQASSSHEANDDPNCYEYVFGISDKKM